MEFIVVALASLGGGLIGYAIGYNRRANRIALQASNLAIACVAVTAEMTYGEQWLEEFLEEVKMVMDLYPDEIIKRSRALNLAQLMREKLEKGK